MKFYKINKNILKFSEMNQINRSWKYPILIDKEYNVYLGNSLKNTLDDEVIVVMVDVNEKLKETLFYIESKIVEENSETRFNIIESEVYNYFRELRKEKYDSIPLFQFKETRVITEELYEKPPEDDYIGHGRKYEDDEIEEIMEEYEIDEEILKELM